MAMYLEFTLPAEGRVYVQADSIVSVAVGKRVKGEPFIVTTTTGATYAVTVETEQNGLARLIGMRS